MWSTALWRDQWTILLAVVEHWPTRVSMGKQATSRPIQSSIKNTESEGPSLSSWTTALVWTQVIQTQWGIKGWPATQSTQDDSSKELRVSASSQPPSTAQCCQPTSPSSTELFKTNRPTNPTERTTLSMDMVVSHQSNTLMKATLRILLEP